MPADMFRTVPLAIVGMGCRLPGADNLDAFWSLLRDGRSGIVTFPEDRLDQRLYYNADRSVKEKSYSNIGGIVPIQPWNRDLSSLPEQLALHADEVHRTMCEVAHAAVRDAGYRDGKSLTANTGVYIGNSSGSNLEADLTYHAHANELADLLREVGTAIGIDESLLQNAATRMAEHVRNTMPSWADTRVSDVTSAAAPRLIHESLRLTGPHFAVDAACASSFTALHLAAMALHAGRIDAAIVGAFSFRNWFEMVLLSPTQTVSSDGSCPFDAHANGMVPSDGYAAIVVKTLQRAIADGDRIDGVIRAMGVSSDGRGKGFWAPRQEGQVAAVRRTYANGIDPARLQYIECHATSTKLGDATEMATLKESLAGAIAPHGPIPIGSVKSNLGHTLEVAGMQGLLKTLLAMKHGQVPPSINCRELNPEVDWAKLPFRVATELTPWPEPADGHPRRAGVNAFGIGGLNLHVVVDDRLSNEERAALKSPPIPQREDIAVIGWGEPAGNASIVQSFLQLVGVRNGNRAADRGEYIFDWKKHRVPPKEVAVTNPLQLMLLDAAVSALEQSGYATRDFDRSRVGTVIGSPFTSDFSCDAFLGARLPEIRETIAAVLLENGVADSQIMTVADQFAETLLDRKPAAKDVTASLSSSTLASRIAKHLDLMGGAFAVDAGAETPQAALRSAMDLLQSGTCDVVFCGVGQRLTDIAFEEQRAAGKGPEWLRQNGPGFGAAVLLLKRAADAKHDGDTILATIPGRFGLPTRSESTMSDEERVQLEQRLVTAVIDMTGLPAELVTLDADLFGDLGIGVAAKAPFSNIVGRHVSADEFQTLRQLIDRTANPVESARVVRETQPTPLDRYVIRTAELPIEPAGKMIFAGPVLIVGDNAVATALRERFTAENIAAHQLPVTAASGELDRLFAQQPIPHLFLTASRDVSPEGPVSQRSLLPFLACQRWLEHVSAAGVLGRASLVAVTALGGDFGSSGRVDSPDGVRGLLKSLHRETKGRLRVRIIDAPMNEPAKMIAAAVMRELAVETADIETATVRGKRYVQRPVRQSVSALPSRDIPRDSVCLAIGIADKAMMGIACDWGKRLGYRFHFLERHSTPAIEDAVRKLTDDGITAVLHVGDFADRDQLANILAEIQRTDGRIAGVLLGHGSFATQPGELQKINLEAVEQSLRDHVDVAASLMESMAHESPAFFVAVSSLHGGNDAAPRTEIAVADDAVAALISRYQHAHPTCRAFTVEVPKDAMAAMVESVTAELQSASYDSEILLLTRNDPKTGKADRYDELRPLIANAALIYHVFAAPNGAGIAEVSYDPVADPFLNGHLDDGVPLLPAVAGIETCAQAASVWSGGRVVLAVHNQQIQNGFRMAGKHRHRARVLINGSGNTVECQLAGEFFDKTGKLTDPHRVYQTCSVDLADEPRIIPAPDFGPPPTTWKPVPYPDDWRDMATADSGTVYYGPELRCLKFVHHTPKGSWGRLTAPPKEELGGSRRGSRWHTPPALLDATLFLCDLHAAETFGTRQLPHVIDRIDFGRLPHAGEECLARVVFREREGRRITWDFWVLGADGAVVLKTQGFHVVTLREPPQKSAGESLQRH